MNNYFLPEHETVLLTLFSENTESLTIFLFCSFHYLFENVDHDGGKLRWFYDSVYLQNMECSLKNTSLKWAILVYRHNYRELMNKPI